tara:strand:- start:5 stop:571 length:567 start_codon:yes stop_codon:yes gene_type:complete
MIEFEFTYKATCSLDWPKLNLLHNDTFIEKIECNKDKFTWHIEPQDKNVLKLDWVNKTEQHTIMQNGKITQDQTFELLNIRVDGIQIENWFMTEGVYSPRYFKGFLQQHKDARKNQPLSSEIKSQLIWHFPGTFTFMEFENDFWDWYFRVKQDKEVIKFLDKDPDRIHKFRGSLDPCEDVVAKIKELI